MSHYLVETDIFVEHLLHKDESESYLEILMQKDICFTTVINASELQFASKPGEELKAVKQVLSSLKVLGLNARYSFFVPLFRQKVKNYRDAIICSVAEINKLTIVTFNEEKYISSGLTVINPKELGG